MTGLASGRCVVHDYPLRRERGQQLVDHRGANLMATTGDGDGREQRRWCSPSGGVIRRARLAQDLTGRAACGHTGSGGSLCPRGTGDALRALRTGSALRPLWTRGPLSSARTCWSRWTCWSRNTLSTRWPRRPYWSTWAFWSGFATAVTTQFPYPRAGNAGVHEHEEIVGDLVQPDR